MSEKESKYEPEFLQLVMGLHGSAWMMLGKVANPLTGKIEKDLAGAKAGIDTLMMLKEKTQGNLSKREEDFLSNILQQLQLNFIDESKKKEPKEEPQREGAREKTPDEAKKKKETKKK